MLQKPNNQQNGVQNSTQNDNNNISGNPMFMRQQNTKNGKTQQLGQSQQQIRENESNFQPLKYNSNYIDDQPQDRFKVLKNFIQFDNNNQVNQFNPQISRNQYNSSQLPLSNIVQVSDSNNVQQNNQLSIQQQQRPRNGVYSLHNPDYGAIMNYQQYNPTPQLAPQQTPQPNQTNPKIKIISKNQNSTLIEIDNKNANFNNHQANLSTSSTLIDDKLFERQKPTQKPKQQELPPQTDLSLFQRTTVQKPQIISKPNNYNNNMIETIFKTKEMNCINCRMIINNLSIGLSCQHFYHKECYNEIINQQIKSGKGLFCCLCNKKIPQKQLKQNLPKETIEEILKNQDRILVEIYNQKMRI